MMHTLRWRIAVSYAVLLAAIILALGFAISLRFEQILRGQAQQHVASTMQDIAHAVLPPPEAFGFAEGDQILALENPDNLEHWASPTTYVEIDDLRGYPLAKSLNMGGITSFGAPELSAQHPSSTREVVIAGRRFLVLSALLAGPAHAAIVQVAEPLDQLYRAFHETRLSIAIILLAAIAAMALLSFVLSSQMTGPINDLASTMTQIGSEGLHKRLRWRGRRDEIGNLAQTFDDLLARLEEAFARERQFISDASHELKTPLTSINANAQMLVRWGDRDEAIRKESLQTIMSESSGLAEMVNGMLTLAKADSGDDIPKEPLSLAALANEAVQATTPRAADKGLTLELLTPAESSIVEGDASLLRQMITNLIDNAIKFTQSGGVTVRVASDTQHAIVEVQDTGPGIDSAELPFVFDRFYRADKSRTRQIGGTGLGLAIVRSIVRVHGGSVEALRPPEGGTLFRVRLPLIH